MPYRPFSIILLGILYIFEPLLKILFYSLYHGVTPLQMLAIEINHSTPVYLVEFFLLGPIIGWIIIMVRPISLPLFFLLQSYLLVVNGHALWALWNKGANVPLVIFFALNFINFWFTLWLLTAPVKAFYTDPKKRWWQAAIRYRLESAALWNEHHCVVENISTTGAMLTGFTPTQLEKVQKEGGGNLSLHYDGYTFNLRGKYIHFMATRNGVGIQFQDPGLINYIRLFFFTKFLEKKGIERRPPKRFLLKEILYFWKTP